MIAALVKPTVVLWVFFTYGWNFGGIPMSRGWFSAYVYETLDECNKTAKEIRSRKYRPTWTVCLPATHEPEGDKGKILRKGMEVNLFMGASVKIRHCSWRDKTLTCQLES